MLKVMASEAANLISRSPGSTAADTGTMGRPMGRPHTPPRAGATPSTSTSAAELHGPRCPASLSAVRRTKRAGTGGKLAVLAVLSSAHWPLPAGAPQDVPSRLTEIE